MNPLHHPLGSQSVAKIQFFLKVFDKCLATFQVKGKSAQTKIEGLEIPNKTVIFQFFRTEHPK